MIFSISRYIFIPAICLASIALSACDPNSSGTAENAPKATSVMTRAEFKSAVVGKSAEEVIKTIGRPETNSDMGKITYWTYPKRTSDPVTGNSDAMAQLELQNGKVVEVRFF